MSSIKISFTAPNSNVYTVETSDDGYRRFADSGEELVDRTVHLVKRMAGMTND